MVIDDISRENTIQVLKHIQAEKGFKKLTQIQKKAYPQIFSNRNLVVVAPSGAGKTLIAELIALKDIIGDKNEEATIITRSKFAHKKKIAEMCNAKTIFLVPLRALAEEKANNLVRDYRHFNLKIHMSMSEIDFDEKEIRKCNILISTYERFRTIIGRMPELIPHVKNVIIDEFHLLGNKKRGPVLEAILTTLLDKVRLILLSATIANPEEVAKWLDAILLISNERQIPLDFDILPSLDPDKIVQQIISRNIANNSQVLIFCGTRMKTEEYADYHSDFIQKKSNLLSKNEAQKTEAFLQSLALPNDTLGNRQLFELAKKGTGFHHAGLGRVARKAVEELFRQKLIKVLFCTETLGAGVNLPAREVIIYETKRWNNEWLSRNVFHQIAGRAGRPGYDVYGKCSVLVSDSQERTKILRRFWQNELEKSSADKLLSIINPRFDAVKSMLTNIEEIEKLVLSLIYNNQPTFDDLLKLLSKTFLDFNRRNELKNKKSIKEWHDESKELFKVLLKQIEKVDAEKLLVLESLFPESKLEIIKTIDGDESQAIYVLDGETQFTLLLESNRLSCSCPDLSFLCKHRIYVMKYLPSYIVSKILNSEFSVLEKLIVNNYVIENAKGEFLTTTKGSICAEMGITRKKFELLKDWLMYDVFTTKPNMTELLYYCVKLIPEIDESDSFIDNMSFKRPIYEHVILGRNILEVIKKHQLYEGDLLRVEVSLKSLIAGLTPLAEYLGLTKLSQHFKDLDKILSDALWHSF
ncbi:MAG: DEAD/DEAH box helicase [Candidatus Heimdallarchaeota archaeon]|nr:DEAD/DEAH box helicase [Candidatus Heimdallarchaeota archaeon]MBY8995757.1 DEAD/DEAH box helicase [Candidatus Heimdallarchaeota archaeon]